MPHFGRYVRRRRSELQETDASFSQRQVALRIGIEPSYLSKIERGHPVALSEEKTIALALDLQEDPDFLLALGGKISTDVLEIIKDRPRLFTRLVREMKDLPCEILEMNSAQRHIQHRMDQTHKLAGVGLYDFSLTEQHSYWTAQTPLILGLPADAPATLESLAENLAPEERNHLRHMQETACKTREPYNYEASIPGLSTPDKHVRIWGMYEYDNSGLPVAVIGVIQDTTDRVAMERELKATKDLLEIKLENASGKVVESIRELKKEIEIRIQTEKSLLAAKEEIQQKAATQRAFFRDSTHILRTSIDNIWKSVLGDIHAEKENSIDFQSLVAGQITHSRMQLDGIIDFLALETGLKPEPEPFDPRDLIKEIEDCFTKECQQCGLTMSTLIAPSTPQMINADKRRISLVLFALLSRSIRLSNWGEVRLTVAIDNELPACFTASIQDTSTPANAVDIKNEFYPTNQIDKKTKEYNSCLSLVGPIIDMLGGTIHTSSIGVGQQISLTIPVALEATKARPPHADPKSNIRLLVVEDDLTSQFLMKRMFTKIDYQADFATNGERALLLAAENKYDAILMDIQLPGLDGLETTRQIRIRTELPNATTPIIAVTAHAMQGDRKACLEAGMTDYLAKPLEFDKLHQAIQTACR